MEDNGLNKDERKLWSNFKKTSRHGKSSCLNDDVLAVYLDGRRRWADKNKIEEHLAACPVCLEKLVELRSLLAVELVETPFELKQKAKGHVAGDTREQVEADVFFWGRLFHLKKSLAWGLVILLIFTSCFTGLKFGRELALSSVMGVFSGQSNSPIESAIDILGV